jgi:ectoine hydroxylase-related dioxygenase (phytanoyl-CoA dioxygenase family)
MGKGCHNRGCYKQARHPSKFCRFHTPTDASAPVAPFRRSPHKSSLSSIAPYRSNRQKSVAYFQNYSLSQHNRPCLEAIQSSISDFASTEYRGSAGVRKLLPIQATVLEELLPFLLSVVAVATKVVAFPLKDPVIHAPVIVVAPPSSSHSNGWSKGSLHRDFDCTVTTGVYSFLLFLDEVTPENGTVAFWRHSKQIGPIDPRHPERALVQSGLKSELLVGQEGIVYVWDSRLLHRSLANRTQKRRLALQWIVTSAARNGVSLSVTT